MEQNGFPSEFVSPEIKATKKYGRDCLRAIYYKSVLRNSYYNESVRNDILNRKYAEGLQSVDKYKDLLDMNGDTSYANLDMSIVPIIPKYVDLLVGEMMNSDYMITCNAVDPISRTSKDQARNRMLANMKLKNVSDELKEISGISIVPDGEFVPETEEELDLHMQMDFKLDIETAFEELLKYCFVNNNWEETKRKLYRDFVVLKKGAVRVYIDENDTVRCRYVDPVNLITSYSENDSYEDIKYAGEVLKMEIHQLRRMSNGELSEEDLFNIARAYSGKQGNAEWNFGVSYKNYYNSTEYSGYCMWDDYLIPVLDAQWHSINTKTFVEKETNYGGFYFEEKKFGYKPQDGKKRKTVNKDIDCVYKGYLVIGTDYTFGYGLKTDQIRKKVKGVYSSDTDLDFIIFSPDKYEMKNKSLVERMRPHGDQIQLIFLKMQVLLAKVAPPGFAIDVTALKDVILGKGVPTSPLDLMEILQQTGVLFYNGTGENGMQMQRSPIENRKDFMGNAFQELIQLYNFNIQQIQDITGLNEARDATSIDKETPVYTQKASLSASRNATRIISHSFLNIYKRASENILQYFQDLIDQGRITNVTNVIGDLSYKTVQLKGDMSAIELGLYLEPMPTEDEKLLIEQNINQSIASGELRMVDAIRIRQIFKTSPKSANQYLLLKGNKYKQEQIEIAQKNSENTQMVQQQSLEAKSAADQQLMELQAQIEQMKIQLKYDLEDRNNANEHQRKLDLTQLEGQIKSTHIEQEGEFKEKEITEEVD